MQCLYYYIDEIYSYSFKKTFVPEKHLLTYPQWPHMQGGCLACMLKVARLQDPIQAVAELHRFILCTRRSGGTAQEGVGCVTSQLDLSSLTPLSVAGYGRLQLEVPHWATSVDY